jgi:hypothetical protein
MDFLVKTHPKMNRFAGIPLWNIAVSLGLLTRSTCQNIVRQAFTYAKRHGYGSVTVIRVRLAYMHLGFPGLGSSSLLGSALSEGFPNLDNIEKSLLSFRCNSTSCVVSINK